MEKSADAYRTISEVAADLKLPQHVLRFWETRFPQIRPLKRGGNRRFYRPDDVDLLRAIKLMLYSDGFTIKGVQRILKERGPRAVADRIRAGTLAAVGSDQHGPVAPVDRDARDRGPERDAASDHHAPVERPSSPTAGAGENGRPGSVPRPGVMPSADAAHRLQVVLFELSECQRILASARA